MKTEKKSNTNIPLVILAAGIGRRFGGNKQLSEVGQAGEYLLEFNLYEAYLAGISTIFLIIKPGSQPDWSDLIERWKSKLDIQLAEQPAELLPGKHAAKRNKPWGTGHALLAIESVVESEFLLINADDYYGSKAFKYLVDLPEPGMAMATFPLIETLSDSGLVNRGICLSRDSILAGIEEYIKIGKEGAEIYGENQIGERQALQAMTPVSMNCWRLDKRIFSQAKASIEDLVSMGIPEDEEIFLPTLIQYGIIEEEWLIHLVEAPGPWYGLTFLSDLDGVKSALQARQNKGEYPTPLWK